MDPPTILALKQAFLERATRQLAQPLAPSRAWRRKNDLRGAGAGGAGPGRADRLPPKAVDDALVRANQLLLQHARRVYAPAAVRHVAEQLDQLYGPSFDPAPLPPPAGEPGEASDVLDRGADYSTAAAISGLPPAWDDPREAEALPLEARRYAELVAQLQALAARRTAAAARVRRLKRMAEHLKGLAPAEAADDDSNPQDNVVTRDGPVERELERMRVLLARVGDRVASLPPRPPSTRSRHAGSMDVDSVEDVETVGQRRVQALLEQF